MTSKQNKSIKEKPEHDYFCYKKLFELFEKKGITTYTIRKENIISQAALTKLKNGGDIDTRTLRRLCKYLKCQVGDIMTYIP